MQKPQEKYDDVFNKLCYPAHAEELFEKIASKMENFEVEYLNELIDIVYCCGFTDGYDEAKYLCWKIK